MGQYAVLVFVRIAHSLYVGRGIDWFTAPGPKFTPVSQTINVTWTSILTSVRTIFSTA